MTSPRRRSKPSKTDRELSLASLEDVENQNKAVLRKNRCFGCWPAGFACFVEVCLKFAGGLLEIC